MDPRERADAALARARARGAFVVTPEDAISPMDAASTLQIPRIVVSSLDQQQGNENEQTMVVQHPLAQSQPTQSQPSPRPPHQQPYAPPQQHHHPQHPSPLPRQAPPQEQDAEPKPQPPKPRRTMSERLDGTL